MEVILSEIKLYDKMFQELFGNGLKDVSFMNLIMFPEEATM